MERKTIDFPDDDTSPYLVDYWICPLEPHMHRMRISNTERYEPVISFSPFLS